MNFTVRDAMRCVEWLLFGALAVAAGGCVTARYHYSIAVPGATAATPATVELHWKGGSRSFTVKSDDCISTRFIEVMQSPGCVFVDIPRGLDVKVTREGYKPWAHHYEHVDEDFRSRRWDSFNRWDVIQLESAFSAAPSKMIDGTTVYR